MNLVGIEGRRNVPVWNQAELTENDCRVIANEDFDMDHWWAGVRPVPCRRAYIDQSNDQSQVISGISTSPNALQVRSIEGGNKES